MDKSTGRLIIVDPSLKDNRGHHYALTCAVVSSAQLSGYEVLVFSNSSVSPDLVISGAKIKPVFSLSTYDYFMLSSQLNKISLKAKLRQYIISQLPKAYIEPLKKIRNKLKRLLTRTRVPNRSNPFLASSSIDKELKEAMLVEDITALDHVLVHTSDAMMYRAILQLIQQPYPGGHPAYHLCTPYDIDIMPHSAKGLPVGRVINYLALMGEIGKHVFLYAENELLADALSGQWGVDVAPLDIPMMKKASAGPSNRDKNSALRVVYLGAARDEKGFNLIPEVAEKLLNLSADGEKIEFVIQCNAQIVGYNQSIRQSIEQLKSFPASYVKLITEQQSMDDYYATLESADVVLACYQHDRYRIRGSCVAAEAVAYGKNLVVTPGTYPEWLAGDAGIAASNSKQIAAAIMNFAENKEIYSEKAKKRADWFAERTRPQKYMSKLVEYAEQARSQRDGFGALKGKKTPGNKPAEPQKKPSVDAEEQDAFSPENKYNARLYGADVSDDGHKLFVKQTGRTDSIIGK